jgi:hypothetical protein
MDHAVLVGINAYPNSPLRGCVNDVQDVATFLKQNYGFNDSNITLLTDGDATKANIVDALKALIYGAATGDRLLFHYSGHGTQMPASGRSVENSICPVDFDFTLDHALTARDFASIFSAIPDGVLFNWLSDSCYSGNLTRRWILGSDSIDRFLTPPVAIQSQIDTIMTKPEFRAFTFDRSSPLNGAYVSGCGAFETSADARFDVNGQTRYSGAFTHFFLQNLKNQLSMPLKTLVTSVVEDLRYNSFQQTPGVKGTESISSQPFLGGKGHALSDISQRNVQARFTTMRASSRNQISSIDKFGAPNPISNVEQAAKRFNDPDFQGRVFTAIKAIILKNLSQESVDLSPAEWGELSAQFMTTSRDSAETLAAGAVLVAVMSFSVSDERLKTDIVYTGEIQRGIPLCEFSYKGFSSRWRGVVAQDVKTAHPECVIEDNDGFLMVDYMKLGVEFARLN